MIHAALNFHERVQIVFLTAVDIALINKDADFRTRTISSPTSNQDNDFLFDLDALY